MYNDICFSYTQIHRGKSCKGVIMDDYQIAFDFPEKVVIS
jgi:hypothetical protein